MMSFSVEEKTLLGIAAFNILLLLIFIIHFIIVYNLSKRKSTQFINDSSGINLSKNEYNSNDEDDKKVLRYIEYKNKRNYMALLIEGLAALVIFELLILALVMFDILHIAAGIIIMFIVASLYWIIWIIPIDDKTLKSTMINSNGGDLFILKFKNRLFSKFKWSSIKSNKKYWLLLIPILIGILALTIMLEGTCEDQLTFIDSRILRKYMKATCENDGKPCFVYLTLNQSPSTSIIANFHTSLNNGVNNNDHPIPICYYDTVSRSGGALNISSYSNSASGNFYKMPLEVVRFVNWVHIDELQPSTTYYFICGTKENGFSEERKFKTQSDNPNDSFSFVVGGDVDVTSDANKISDIAAKQEPQFAMVGGDLAYDHAQYTCYRIVDKWLNNWQTRMITPQGYTIPIIASIGNHEVIGDYDASSDRIPFFLRYFPQFTRSQDPGDGKNIDNRPSYGSVNIGGEKGTVIFNLDSGHHSSLNEQANWMNQQLNQGGQYSNTSLRFSIYHVPMYPTFRDYANSRSTAVRNNWLSIFDQHHFNIGFENHDHAYKRTLPLNNNQVSNDTSKSTVYIGDGAWGTSIRPLTTTTLKWYQSFSKSTHYITSVFVNATSKSINFKSIDQNEVIFDKGDINY